MIAAIMIAAITGIIPWHPPVTNYVESPWLIKDGERVYLGGHAGYCCEDYIDGQRNHDRLWASVYYRGRVSRISYPLADSSKYDDHEVGGYSPIRINGWWYMLGARTERSYWGQGNRLRPFMFMVGSSLSNLWTKNFIVDRTPVFLPIQPECAEMGDAHEFCKNSIGCGQNGSITTTLDGRILIMSKDDVGPLVQNTSRHMVHELNLWTWRAYARHVSYWGCRLDLPGGLCPALWPSFGDWGRIPGTNVFRAYTGNKNGWEWYQNTEIMEWESWDEGFNWFQTGRRWKPDGGGCAWDVAVMKNPDGTIATPLTLATVYSSQCGWATDGSWVLWYWTEGPKNPFAQGATRKLGRLEE